MQMSGLARSALRPFHHRDETPAPHWFVPYTPTPHGSLFPSRPLLPPSLFLFSSDFFTSVMARKPAPASPPGSPAPPRSKKRVLDSDDGNSDEGDDGRTQQAREVSKALEARRKKKQKAIETDEDDLADENDVQKTNSRVSTERIETLESALGLILSSAQTKGITIESLLAGLAKQSGAAGTSFQAESGPSNAQVGTRPSRFPTRNPSTTPPSFVKTLGCSATSTRPCGSKRSTARKAITTHQLDLNKTWLQQSKTNLSLVINQLVQEIPQTGCFDDHWGAEWLLVETFNHMRGHQISITTPEEVKERKRKERKEKAEAKAKLLGEASPPEPSRRQRLALERDPAKVRRPSRRERRASRGGAERAEEPSEQEEEPSEQEEEPSEQEEEPSEPGEDEEEVPQPAKDVSKPKPKPKPRPKPRSKSTGSSENSPSKPSSKPKSQVDVVLPPPSKEAAPRSKTTHPTSGVDGSLYSAVVGTGLPSLLLVADALPLLVVLPLAPRATDIAPRRLIARSRESPHRPNNPTAKDPKTKAAPVVPSANPDTRAIAAAAAAATAEASDPPTPAKVKPAPKTGKASAKKHVSDPDPDPNPDPDPDPNPEPAPEPEPEPAPEPQEQEQEPEPTKGKGGKAGKRTKAHKPRTILSTRPERRTRRPRPLGWSFVSGRRWLRLPVRQLAEAVVVAVGMGKAAEGEEDDDDDDDNDGDDDSVNSWEDDGESTSSGDSSSSAGALTLGEPDFATDHEGSKNEKASESSIRTKLELLQRVKGTEESV
ncbi:hypothetical protein RhiJN_09564 [Ceratobasidium sp. AG-Ba]|nr:hypothetical protein RhiJN_09564 [Ceratobasidium sp. AG-Ba]